MIIDCFTFFNELDLLEARLEYLDPIVDYFVLVESNVTFTGKQKPLIFCDNQIRYSKYKSKILYYPFIFDNTIHKFNFDQKYTEGYTSYAEAPWQVEYMQRNHIANALKIVDGNPFVMISDVDEIPSIGAIDFAARNLSDTVQTMSFVTKIFFYNIDTTDRYEWPSVIFTTKNMALDKTPQFLRSNHRNEQIATRISNGGWHLSFFGGIESIQYKIDSYSHQEYNPDAINKNNIESAVETGTWIFDRQNTFEKTDRSIFPEDFRHAFRKFFI